MLCQVIHIRLPASGWAGDKFPHKGDKPSFHNNRWSRKALPLSQEVSSVNPSQFRQLSAEGRYESPTAGVCNGYVQANLVALPERYAVDFAEFCRLNPQPCPLLEQVGPNNHLTSKLANSADLLTTIPKYLVWKDGRVLAETPDIRQFYRDDLVFFLLGCSFSFEEALSRAGIPLRHLAEGKNVSMYNTNIELNPAGPFSGNMVVTMRPIHHRLVAKACAITAHFPDVHGEPVHVGDPELIGIEEIGRADYGDTVEIRPGEIPVFWACGVTPQNVLVKARLPFAITHAPGYMFVGDVLNKDFARCSFLGSHMRVG